MIATLALNELILKDLLQRKLLFCAQCMKSFNGSLCCVITDDDDSGDDDDYLSRNAIKRNSQQIVDSKTKKHKARPKRKNKK